MTGLARDSVRALAEASWADALGCDIGLLATPGVHMVPGGPALAGYEHVLLARIDDSVLVYAPHPLRDLIGLAPDEVFTPTFAASLAGDRLDRVLGPAWHGFATVRQVVAVEARGGRVELAALEPLRTACAPKEWAEGGFVVQPGGDTRFYAIEEDGELIAAGNLTPFRGVPADVGLITHPAHRGRGLAVATASTMVKDAMSWTDLVRYRALVTNHASLAVARRLGFVGVGRNIAVRLEP